MLHIQVAKAKHEANIYLENREQSIVSSKIKEDKVRTIIGLLKFCRKGEPKERPKSKMRSQPK